MPKILSINSRYKPTIFKENIFERFRDWFNSLDTLVKYAVLILGIIFIAGIVTTGVIYDLKSHASTTISTQLIDNFDEDTTAVSGWSLNTWPTGPTGTFTVGQGANYTNNPSDKAAYINFTFQSSAAGDQQVSMDQTFATSQPQAAELGFFAKTPSGASIIVYAFDSTGQRFEYDTERPLESNNSNNWYQEVIKLDEQSHHSGGANDGIVHYPIKRISIAATALIGGSYDNSDNALLSGQIGIDDVEWLDVNTTTVTRTVDPQDPAIILPPTAISPFINNLSATIHGTIASSCGTNVNCTPLSDIKQSGINWARFDLWWNNVEQSPGIFNWSYYDSEVSALQSIGVKTLFILGYGNTIYGSPTIYTPPSSSSDPVMTHFLNYVTQAASHYASNANNVAFEVWGEENYTNSWPNPACLPGGQSLANVQTYCSSSTPPTWCPSSCTGLTTALTNGAATYKYMLSQAIPIIKKTNPNFKIISGGTADFDWSYWNNLFPNLSPLSDIIGVHPYRSNIPESISDGILATRNYLPQINISEWGYPTDPTWWNFGADSDYIASQANTISALQAKMVSRELWTSVALGVQALDYYKLKETETTDLFGLKDLNDNPKPSWSSFTTATKFMQQFPTFVGIEPMQLTNLHTLVLKNSSQYLLVLWKDGATSQVLDNIPSLYSIQSATDYMGNNIPVSGNAIWVNDTPVYVVVNNPNAPTPTPTTAPVLIPTPTLAPLATPTPTPVVDTAPPTVSVTSPTGGTVSRHSTVTITASASDDTKVTQVIFYVNGSTVCTDTSTPYTCGWSVPGKPKATYTITAKAIDAGNYYTISAPVNVTVN